MRAGHLALQACLKSGLIIYFHPFLLASGGHQHFLSPSKCHCWYCAALTNRGWSNRAIPFMIIVMEPELGLAETVFQAAGALKYKLAAITCAYSLNVSILFWPWLQFFNLSQSRQQSPVVVPWLSGFVRCYCLKAMWMVECKYLDPFGATIFILPRCKHPISTDFPWAIWERGKYER